MAKIRNVYINCNSDDIKKSFNVNITYSAKEKRFEILLPPELKLVIVNIPDQEIHEMGIRRKRSFSDDKLADDYLVIGDTEALVEKTSQEIFTFLNKLQIRRRNVIVIDFYEYDNGYYRSLYNGDHPKIGLQFGLLYCIETTAGIDGKPNYTTKEIHNGGPNNSFTTTKHCDVSGKAIVIDDNNENRLFLENTYGLLSKLISELAKHCKSNEALLQLIASNQKLLG